jgi:hypothetical protein
MFKVSSLYTNFPVDEMSQLKMGLDPFVDEGDSI